MTPWLEIVLPVRNPGSKLGETVASLVAQTTRGFGVVLSDNWSSSGFDHLDAAQGTLESAAIPVRRVKPPFELGRVQHWNWAHFQGQAEWLKPLFVGDLLLPACVARMQERIQRRPESSFLRFEFEVRQPETAPVSTHAEFPEEFLSPREFLRWFPTRGNWIGGPVNVAYRRAALVSAGGYSVQLPACADYALFSMLAVRHGMEVIHEVLAIFQLHEQRFSHGITKRKVNGYFEYWILLCRAAGHCRAVGLAWPALGASRALAGEFRVHYCREKKRSIKHLIKQWSNFSP